MKTLAICILLLVTPNDSHGENSQSQDLAISNSTRTKSITNTIGSMASPGDTTTKTNQILELESTTIMCPRLKKDFHRRWRVQSTKLQLYLTRLKDMNCSEFQEECKDQIFAVTRYTQLVYWRLCNFTVFQTECKYALHGYRIPTGRATYSDYAADVGSITIQSFYDSQNGLGVLQEPCIQALLEEASYRNMSFSYREVRITGLPFCGIVWTAFPTTAFTVFDVSASTLIPARCRNALLIYLSFLTALSVGVTLGNILVIVILHRLKRAANSQWVFKISLAVADLIAGIIALPGMVLIVAQYFSGFYEVTGNRRLIYPKLPGEVVGMIGFFTNLSLTVSVYSLLIASVDRFMVVYRPFDYEKHKAFRLSKLSVLILWGASSIYSALPFIVDSLDYAINGVIVTFLDEIAIVIYCAVIGAPLLLMWALNIGTYCYYRCHAQKTSAGGVKVDGESDKRLMRTLSIMVGAFTFCLLSLLTIMVVAYATQWRHFGKYESGAHATSSTLEAIGMFILMSNSFWNFIIYNVRSLEFRRSVYSLFCDMRKKIGDGLRNRVARRTLTDGLKTSSYWIGSTRSLSAERNQVEPYD